MSEENQNATEPIVRKGIRPRSKILAIIAFVLVAVAIAGFIIYEYQTRTKIVLPPHLTASQQSDYLANKGDYSAAQKIVVQQIAKAPNSTAKAGLYMQQATIALNAKNYVDAKKYAQAAESLQPGDNTASLLGYIASQTGDKAAAKQYYQKAIDRLDKTAESYNASLQDYQTHLQELGQ